jgi:hypothetical protein
VRAVTFALADEDEPEDRKAPDSRAGTLHTALDRKGVPTALRSAFFKRLFYRNHTSFNKQLIDESIDDSTKIILSIEVAFRLRQPL